MSFPLIFPLKTHTHRNIHVHTHVHAHLHAHTHILELEPWVEPRRPSQLTYHLFS